MKLNQGVSIPSWLQETNRLVQLDKSTNSNFLIRTLRRISKFFLITLVKSQTINNWGYLQALDARLKIIFLLFAVVTLNLSSNFIIYFSLLITILIYAKLSKLRLVMLLISCWLTIPFILLLFSLPAISNLVIDGHSLFKLIQPNSWLRDGLYITSNGLLVTIKIVLRSGITLSLAYVIFATTPWSLVMAALLKLKLPRLIVELLDISYRYVFLIIKMANNMTEARYLRTIGNLSLTNNRSFVAHTIARLFVKANFIAHEVSLAMKLRGYREYRALYEFKLNLIDYLFILTNVLIFFLTCGLKFIFT